MKKRSLKPLWILLIVVASLMLLAVLLGVLNALIGKGQWKIGWQNYRYDEEGYQVGGCTVYDKGITGVEIDWTSGEVDVVITEDDAYPSLYERAGEEDLSTSAQLRWKVDGDGILSVKWRKSGTFLWTGMPDKKLTVRIPVRLAEELKSVKINTVSAPVQAMDLTSEVVEINTVSGLVGLGNCNAQEVRVQTVSGNVSISGQISARLDVNAVSGNLQFTPDVCPPEVTVQSVKGSARLTLPETSSFRLEYHTVSGRLVSDFAMTTENGASVYGTGDSLIRIETTSGGVTLEKK